MATTVPRARRGGAEVVQGLLAEVRELKVEKERLRLQVKEIRDRSGAPDHRLKALESEVRRLRDELSDARQERDSLLAGIDEALEKLSRG